MMIKTNYVVLKFNITVLKNPINEVRNKLLEYPLPPQLTIGDVVLLK